MCAGSKPPSTDPQQVGIASLDIEFHGRKIDDLMEMVDGVSARAAG